MVSKNVATVDTSNAVPAHLAAYLADYKGTKGTENIDQQDVTIPRIKLAQGTSPEVKSGQIPEGSLFLNVTGQVLAAPGERLNVVPVVRGKEFVLWKDQNFEGGGVFARACRVVVDGEVLYEWDKQDQSFENKIKGVLPVTWKTKRYVEDNNMHKFGSSDVNDPNSHPAATAHHNYVVILPDFNNMVAALSLSNTAVKKAKDLNSMLLIGEVPIFLRIYSVGTVEEQNKANQKYKNYDFKPNGFVEGATAIKFNENLYKSFSEKGFVVDQSDKDNGTTTEKF